MPPQFTPLGQPPFPSAAAAQGHPPQQTQVPTFGQIPTPADKFRDAMHSTQGPAATPDDMESRVGLQWVNRIGAFTLILAAIFVFKYASDNDWIGPGLRVLLGVLAGLATLAGAEFLWRRAHAVVAQGVAGLGVAILYLSVYAAYDWYSLLVAPTTFALLGALSIGAGALALRFRSQALAVLAALGALITPPIVSTGESHVWALSGYLLLIAALSVFLHRLKPWPIQAWVVYLGAKLLYWASLVDDNRQTPGNPALVVGLAFYALYLFSPSRWILGIAQVSLAFSFLANDAVNDLNVFVWQLALPVAIGIAVSEWRRYALTGSTAVITAFCIALLSLFAEYDRHVADPVAWGIPEMTILGLLWLLPLVWIPWGWLRRDDAEAPFASFLFAAKGLAAAACAVLFFDVTGMGQVALLLFAMGAIYLCLASLPAEVAPFQRVESLRTVSQALGVFLVAWAIPLQFDGVSVTILWALLALGLAWFSSRQPRLLLDAGSLLLFALAGGAYLINDLGGFGLTTGVAAISALLAGILCAASAFGAAWLWRSRELTWFPYIAGHAFLLLALLNQIWSWSNSFTGGDLFLFQTAGVSVLLSIYGASLVAAGIVARSRANRIAGLSMLAFVVVKLYLIDIWTLNTIFRIMAFGALGTMLLATSFLYSRLKHTVRQLIGNDGAPDAPAASGPVGPPPVSPPPPSNSPYSTGMQPPPAHNNEWGQQQAAPPPPQAPPQGPHHPPSQGGLSN